MHRVSKLKLAEVTPYLVCKLCNGYFIDPCTAQDCLHTFCKTCIVKHLYQHCTCPICDVVIHKTRPLEMIRHDQTIQDLVYKLVPGVFGKEMERRREFYSDHPDPDVNGEGNSEERGGSEG
ncbi:BMI1 [Bugula neritina]|uniref:BMI1 n=1 Tax=Bugula neritina TaxID=10212 RepID=A0A7J7JXS1_BUGNE|nr:BMI1 [Bugula neritina]